MNALTDLTPQALAAQFAEWGAPPSHAARLLRHFYNRGGTVDWDELLVGKALQERILRELPLRSASVSARHESTDGTVKFLLAMARGGSTETVLMTTPYAERAAGCVSSQIGCAMGCDFCASTRRGLERNLEAGEIVEQFLYLRAEALATNRRLSTLVFMGMGEPFHNFENVVEAIRRIASPDLGGLGWRQVTVSTVGIVPGIRALADLDLNINLALSLHAPDDATRATIVPANRRFPVAEIIDATKYFYEKTGRITNIEYCMLAGINDSDEHARMLAELLRGFRTHINLIPYNFTGAGVSGRMYTRPQQERLDSFLKIVRAAGFIAHFRVTRGDDVNAACGQLRETMQA
jgi:23S rRNA (adenine2503-C2)-methyltransferase